MEKTMAKISILQNGLKEIKTINEKLLERDSTVNVVESFSQLKGVESEILICGPSIQETYNDNQLISQARELKIKKIILIAAYGNEFSLEKHLGEALIKINYIEKDDYCLETLLAYSLESQKFITGSKESMTLKNLAKKVANTDVTVFINGPTGTGKEVVANYIHDQSARFEKPFVAVNCAAIPENMLEAILFGHEKGSFTGASNANKGIFRAADQGTLLLDEISEMPLSLQAKLLRVLQERKVTPVGGNRDIEINVRIVATTNRNMLEEVKNNKFREDLYYRLNVFPIKTFDLNNRIEDVLPITVSMIKKYFKGKNNIPYLTKDAQNVLLKHNWSGNVRELENVILRALVLSNSDDITANHIVVDDNIQNNNKFFLDLDEKLVAAGN
tara:strand:+ start:544 stop:1707 length:1164 start_codon:yes stop_codon:yes gene_type:complete